jgi:nicotinamidase-related amidase
MGGTTQKALLILDMFNAFDFPGGDALASEALQIAPVILQLRDRFHAANRPVIYVNDNVDRWQDGFDELISHFERATPAGRRIVGTLRPTARDLKLLKPRHSAFFETALPSLLKHLKVTSLVITGVAADSCVLCSALDAYVRGYDLAVINDAVASQSPERTRRTLEHLRETYAVDTPAAAAIAP